MIETKKSAAGLLARKAVEVAPPDELGAYPGKYVFAECTATDTGAKIVFQIETDEDVKTLRVMSPTPRWFVGTQECYLG